MSGALPNLVLGSALLSLIHNAIPNHWMPVLALSRSERWSNARTVEVAALAAAAHSASTILIGIVVGVAGIRLANWSLTFMQIAAPSALIGFGSVYLVLGIRGRGHHHADPQTAPSGGRNAIVLPLLWSMFFMPCPEIETYYFTASLAGWPGIAVVSVTYFVATVLGLTGIVWLGRKGTERLSLHFLDHHEKAMTGAVLVGMGIWAWAAGG